MAEIVHHPLIPPMWRIVADYLHRAEVEMFGMVVPELGIATRKWAKTATGDGYGFVRSVGICGEVNVLEWFVGRGCYPPAHPSLKSWGRADCEKQELLTICIENGRPEAVRWLCEHGYPRPHELYELAVRKGNVEVVSYLHTLGFVPTERTVQTAALHGLEMIKAVRQLPNPCPWGRTTYMVAITANNLKLVEYLYANNCPVSAEPNEWRLDVVICVSVRSIEMLDLLLTMPALCIDPLLNNPDLSCEIARDNNIALLEHALNLGAVHDSETCAAAAANEHWKIVMWLRDRGCPWSESTHIEMRQCTDPAVVAWMAAGGDRE